MAALPDRPTWPNSQWSRQIRLRPHEWHVQEAGSGRTILLLHGAGGATHSWRDVFPALAAQAHVVCIDLPGHGLTRLGTRHRSGLEQMTADLHALCLDQGWNPAMIVGHSAGAAIALRLADRFDRKPRVVGINPALAPFRGLAGIMFPVAARMLAMTPFMVDVVLRSTRQPGRVLSLLKGTGSQISVEGQAQYARLFRDRTHVDGTLLMMAQWKLDGLLADLPKLNVPCLFLTGSGDKTVPPDTAVDAAARMPCARVETYDGLGHLLHEERSQDIAQRLLTALEAKVFP